MSMLSYVLFTSGFSHVHLPFKKQMEYPVCMKSETEGRVTVEPIIQAVVLHLLLHETHEGLI